MGDDLRAVFLESLEGVDGAKQSNLGGTDDGAERLGLGKAGDSLEGLDDAGQSELGRTGDGGAGGDGVGDDGAGAGRAGGSGAGNGGVGIGGVGNSRAGNGKRGKIGAPEESSPSGWIWIPASTSSSMVSS